ncbi:Hpt domain-containing protein [Shewanella livingstonensis]|uniref:HPt domain-containing protein n=1 Tax=Shewanella livingstonensis TaxID=150120 RepID=A0A3G8LUG1_9GAMM|nr:Hpt domain-containing protein [Shewanella livingstonensis]AZG73209.1 hypothetical protein EGC82_10785 [Shewanella livingstonensis]
MKANKNLVNQQPIDEIDNNIVTNCSSESDNKALDNLLKPFGGNEIFYRRLINIFETNLKQQFQNLDLMIEQKNAQEILAIVHTLKGSSGSTGLSSLHQALCDSEANLKQAHGTNTYRFEMLCVDLVQQLRFVAQAELSNIHSLLLKESPKTTAALPATNVSSAELTLMLAKLKQHLKDGNLQALDITAQLQNKLSDNLTLENELTTLSDAVEMLDFDQALDALCSLSQKLK